MCMNTNHKFINDIKDYMYNAMWESISEERMYACGEHEMNCGYIDIETNVADMVQVKVVKTNCNKSSRNYRNVEAAIKEVIPSWEEVQEDIRENNEDEYQRNGFANEQDYLRYRYG